METLTINGPHNGQPVLTAGVPLAEAQAAMIMVHGRGGSADDILSLSHHVQHEQFIFLAPQAAGYSWYPNRFLAPIASNEPWLSSALGAIGELLQRLEAAGIPSQRTVLLGFSQGACLSLEYAARYRRRYGAVVGLSGALIGPLDSPRDQPGGLAGTPVFLGCSDIDDHIPLERVKHASQLLRRIGGEVDERIYPGMGHTINQDEAAAVRTLMGNIVDNHR